MQEKLIIGISGTANSGKNLFADILTEILNKKIFLVEQFALANKLKQDVAEILGIDPKHIYGETKEKIRATLVHYAKEKRKATKGRYLTDYLMPRIKNSTAEIVIITDIRYDDFPKDEVFWLKNELNGVLVHLTKYTITGKGQDIKLVNFPPANEEEKRNDPKLKEQADFCIKWPHSGGAIKILRNKYVVPFCKWLVANKLLILK